MKSHDLVAAEKLIRAEMRAFYLDVTAWAAVPAAKPQLKWESVPYKKSSKGLLPKAAGLYAFILSPNLGTIPPHGFLLYVGRTGGDTSRATIRSRFGQYLLEKDNEEGRAAVRSMLTQYETNLMFHFAPVANLKAIAGLEDALIKATRPPFNKLIAEAKARYVHAAAFDR